MLGSGEEGLEGVVAGNHKTSDVGQKLTAKVEDDEEEIKQDSAENSIGLGNTALSLEVDESRVPAQLEGGIMSALTISKNRRAGHCAASNAG